jgi:hypothetical protein
MRPLGYSDRQQPIIFTVKDQRWDGNLRQQNPPAMPGNSAAF